MLQFVVADGPAAGQAVTCHAVPFTIGRRFGCDFQLSEPGVWEEHAEIVQDLKSGKFLVRPLGEALVLLNGERCDLRPILPGDELLLGAVRLTVSLAPIAQKALRGAEFGVWGLVALAAVLELLLIVSLR